jgi:hypothetical protein
LIYKNIAIKIVCCMRTTNFKENGQILNHPLSRGVWIDRIATALGKRVSGDLRVAGEFKSFCRFFKSPNFNS